MVLYIYNAVKQRLLTTYKNIIAYILHISYTIMYTGVIYMDYSLEIEGIDADTALKAMSCSYEDYMDILTTYYRTLNSRIDEIRQAYEKMDIPNYIILVHGLKSSSRAIGAYKLGDMAYGLELAGKAGDTDTIRHNTDAFLDYVTDIYNRLSQAFETNGYLEDASEEELVYMLTELKEYMGNNDIIMVNDIMEQLESVYVNDTAARLIKRISELSLQMEYGQCIELIDDYLI